MVDMQKSVRQKQCAVFLQAVGRHEQEKGREVAGVVGAGAES